MNKLTFICTRIFLITFVTVIFSISSEAQIKTPSVPPEVQAIVGDYVGAWTSYGLNNQGEIVQQAMWTDSLKAENPVVANNRAYVTTSDALIFAGGKIPPTSVSGKEGYSLNPNGSLGDYFIEVYGQTYIMSKIGENVWSYVTPASAREFPALGKEGFISAQHVLIKVITFEQGIETHNISRLTTLRWKDIDGKERTTQFVSLQGRHQRQKS